jgi:hypothetical protein
MKKMENLKLLRKVRKVARQAQNVRDQDVNRSIMFQSYYFAVNRDLDTELIDDDNYQAFDGNTS